MAFPHLLVISGLRQRVIPVFIWQRLFICQQGDHLLQGTRIAATPDGEFIITLKLTCTLF